MFKNKKLILITTFIVVVFLIISGLFILFYPIINVESIITSKLNSGYTITSNKERVEYTNSDYTFNQLIDEFYIQYEYIVNDYNPIKPTITYIADREFGNIDIKIYKLNRTSLFDYEIENRYTGYIQNKSFQEAKDLAKKYDFSKENPDEENIFVNTPPTREEVERRKKEQELADRKDENEEYKRTFYNCQLTYLEEAKPYLIYDEMLDQMVGNAQFEEELQVLIAKRRKCEKQVDIDFGFSK